MRRPLIPTIVPIDTPQPPRVVGLHVAAADLALRLTHELVNGPVIRAGAAKY
jgi:hypothetical protein